MGTGTTVTRSRGETNRPLLVSSHVTLSFLSTSHLDLTSTSPPNLPPQVKSIENTLEPLFAMWKEQRHSEHEAFGSFAHRVGHQGLTDYAAAYTPVQPCEKDLVLLPMPKALKEHGIVPANAMITSPNNAIHA